MAARILEMMGHDVDARPYWQACADDMKSALPDKKNLRDNPYYVEAMAKLQKHLQG